MDDPIKIIWKYKNNNRRNQYSVYIFIGDVPANIMKILDKIKDLSLFKTFESLDKDEYDKLNNFYGYYWYKKFFTTMHINSTIAVIRDTQTQKNLIINKFGNDWYNEHIENYKIYVGKIIYSYDALIKDERERKEAKKTRQSGLILLDEEPDLDYTTTRKKIINKNLSETLDKFRGFEQEVKQEETKKKKDSETDSNIEDFMSDTFEDIEIDYKQEGGFDDDDEAPIINEEETIDIDEEIEDGLDIDDENADIETEDKIEQEELEEIYKEIDQNVDENSSKTSELIKKALDDDKIFDKRNAKMIDFDVSKEDVPYDEQIKDVYQKNYIKTQYIFKDDTIKNIKNKICCSIKNNPKFGSESFLIPSRQYLWSEYIFNDKIEKVMIGQKWMRRTEILTIDIEPNTNIKIYEELRGNLRNLRDNLKRYGNKIRWDDDENNILFDYENYFTNNEIFMLDIYNELGKGYSSSQEAIKNLTELYIKLYFHKIKTEDINYIINYLNGDKKTEVSKIVSTFDTINNDLVMENEIIKEVVKNTHTNKEDVHITQSVIHVNLRVSKLSDGLKPDLYRIFNEFELSEIYPFIQYQAQDGQLVYKYDEKVIQEYSKDKNNLLTLNKWFENTQFGISFKVKIVDKGVEKYMPINLTDNNRIEYKTVWKEDEFATIKDIANTYKYIKDLVEKINKEKNKIKYEVPEDSEFKFAFINTIQKFTVPDKYVVNHNDLSDFARFFYPYIAVVIDPRKRKSNIYKDVEESKSKYGTYLRYKRVTKYEHNTRIEHRIIYFMRNYEYTEKQLITEISKQFNITEEKAKEDIERVKSKYPYGLKKTRKVLKKLDTVPKYKPPGIGVDIQGKLKENYKIRISGARDKLQLDRITNFINTLINLYVETYLLKKPERQELKDKLKKLTNIAKRRNKVDEIDYNLKEIRSVKQLISVDKKRLGFKPDQGQNQWSRCCQNSGKKRRQPQQYNINNMGELLKKGYSLNKKTGLYERKVNIKGKGSKKQEVVLKTIKVPELDEEGQPTGNDIYYACSPDDNGEYTYVGFLTRCNNPFGQCMPCCFKKDPFVSANTKKKEFQENCMVKGKSDIISKEPLEMQTVDKLYILQDTNKVQEGRFAILPKYLDILFNSLLEKDKKMKTHYLIKSVKGYFLKYGSRQDDFQFLNAIASIFNITLEQLKEKLIKALDNDKTDMIFTSLNNGDIKTKFNTRQAYIDFIQSSPILDFEIINNILSIPSVIDTHGINIVVFDKKTISIKQELEKEKTRDDFILLCQNYEDKDSIYDPKRKTIFIIKENKNYFPIVMVQKETDDTKKINIIKTFNYNKDKDNIVNLISDFYIKNCHGSFVDNIGFKIHTQNARETINIINTLDKDFQPKYQFIDTRNRCKYIITQNNLIIPVRPSGSLYNIQIVKYLDKYIGEFNITLDRLFEVYNKTNKALQIKPTGVYYDERKGNKIKINAIMTQTKEIVPVIPIEMDLTEIQKLNLQIENKPLFDKVDKEIAKGKTNIIIDDRIKEVNYDKYMTESYELFRLEFSDYINREENIQIKKRLENIMTNTKATRRDIVNKIRLLIYRLVDRELFDLYKRLVERGEENEILEIIDDVEEQEKEDSPQQEGGKYDKLAHITNNMPNLNKYEIKNDRDVCRTLNFDKNLCLINPHCKLTRNGCYFSLTKKMVIIFVNKISEELSRNELKAFEIMRVGNYFVSDIVDYNRFNYKEGQKIVKSTSTTIKNVLNDLFGKANIPFIGKKKSNKLSDIDINEINELQTKYPLKEMKEHFEQEIISNNMTLLRSYVNAYYWLKNSYFDIETRNLGYYSTTQTDLSIYFRSIMIDWLKNPKNKDDIMNNLVKFIDTRHSNEVGIINNIIKSLNDVNQITNCIIELYILNKLENIPIIIFDDDDNIIYVFNNGGLKYSRKGKLTPEVEGIIENKNRKNCISLRFNYITQKDIPDDINVLYWK